VKVIAGAILIHGACILAAVALWLGQHRSSSDQAAFCGILAGVVGLCGVGVIVRGWDDRPPPRG
jgi:hypothetical protein